MYLLRRLQTDTNTLELLYSSLYGMHLIPSNRTGENPLWESSEPYVSIIESVKICRWLTLTVRRFVYPLGSVPLLDLLDASAAACLLRGTDQIFDRHMAA